MARSAFNPPATAVPVGLGSSPFTREQSSGSYRPFRPGVSGELLGSNECVPDAAELARLTAIDEGREQGLEEGRAQGRAELADEIERFKTSATDAVRLRSVLVESYRRELVELAVAAAEAVVQAELSERTELVEGLIEQALAGLGRREPLRLTVGPRDAERLEAWLAENDNELPETTIKVDDALTPGDIRLESAAGSIDCLMQERLSLVRELVLGGGEVLEERG